MRNSNSPNKRKLLVLILTTILSKFKAQDIYIAMIAVDSYCVACYFKGAQVFAVFMRDIEYQAEKKSRARSDPKTVVSQEYHNFLHVFSKNDSNTFSLSGPQRN